jgi:uncharacterized small protein (DUF1192 family)
MASGNGQEQPDNIATTVTEVSERMSVLVREEIELAKAEMTEKAMSIARGTAAVAAGAVFGVFALIFGLSTLAWGINAIFVDGVGNIWLGFCVVFGLLTLLALGAFLFAWRKLKVGPPTPKMAIDEAKRIRETVAAGPEGGA